QRSQLLEAGDRRGGGVLEGLEGGFLQLHQLLGVRDHSLRFLYSGIRGEGGGVSTYVATQQSEVYGMRRGCQGFYCCTATRDSSAVFERVGNVKDECTIRR